MITATIGNLKSASFHAVKISATGQRKDLGIIAYWHRNPIKRGIWAAQRFMKDHWGLASMMAVSAVIPNGSEPSALIAMATVFTHAGKAIVTNRIIGGGTEPRYVAWGTGAGTAAVGDTTLFTEASEARTLGTSSRVTTSVTNDTYQVVGTITATGSKTITNAGLFDASTVGNLLVKGDFTGIALNVNEGIQFTIALQFT